MILFLLPVKAFGLFPIQHSFLQGAAVPKAFGIITGSTKFNEASKAQSHTLDHHLFKNVILSNGRTSYLIMVATQVKTPCIGVYGLGVLLLLNSRIPTSEDVSISRTVLSIPTCSMATVK